MLQGVVTAVATPVSTTLAIVLLAAILVAVLLHAFSGKSCLRIPAYFLIVRNTNAYAIIAGTIAAVNAIVKSDDGVQNRKPLLTFHAAAVLIYFEHPI